MASNAELEILSESSSCHYCPSSSESDSIELLQVAIRFKKHLEKETTNLPFFRCRNKWRNKVGVVSKQLKDGAHSPISWLL